MASGASPTFNWKSTLQTKELSVAWISIFMLYIFHKIKWWYSTSTNSGLLKIQGKVLVKRLRIELS